MDANFWTGIIIGALISLFTSFIANFYTDELRQYLNNKRHIRLSRRKERELKTFRLVKGVRDGDSLALLRLTRIQDFSTRMLIFTAIMFCLLAASPSLPGDLRAIFSTAVGLFTLFTIGVSYATQIYIDRTINKAEKLDQYVMDIRTKWGNDAI